MIRDPSDGTVREKSVVGIPATETTGIIPAIDPGLPDAPAKSDELIRLEKSREWLREYNAWLMTIAPGQVD